MALSGNFSTNKYSGDIGLKLSWTGTQSIVNNSTTIKWTLTSVGGSSGSWWYAAPITVTIGGKTVLSVTSRFKLYGGGAYKKTGSITVVHNEDGSKSVAMSVKAAIYSTSVNCTGSHTYTLDKISRYALISSVADFNDEEDATVVFTNPAGIDITTDLKVRMMWNNDEDATEYVDVPEQDWGGGSIVIDLDDYRQDLRSSCPNSKTLGVKFDLQSTMNEVEYHHYYNATMEIVNAEPIPKTVSFLEMDDDVYDITGNRTIIIQRQSTLRIKMIEAEPQKSATIVSYSMNFNGEDFTPILEEDEPSFVYVDFIKPNLSGVYTATFTITDSRGNVVTTNIDIPILDWSEPTADVSLTRQNGFERFCDLAVTPHYSSISGINSVKAYQKNRIINTPTWSQEVEILQNPTIVELANTNEWEMIVRIEDKFTSTEYRVTVGKGIPLFFFDTHRNSIAFNEIPDENEQFKIGGTLKVKPNDTDAGVKLPHVYSATEQIVGYWLDNRPIYRKVIELTTDISVNANTWKNTALTVEEDIIVIGGKAMYYSSQYDMFSIWNFIAFQTNTSNKKAIDLYNSRDTSCNINRVIIDYIKPTQNNV